MDLTPRADHSPVLKLRTGRGNTAKTLLFHLQDKSQTVATWIFPLPAPSSAFNFVLPIDSAPLAKPNRIEKTEGANIEPSAGGLRPLADYRIPVAGRLDAGNP